MNDDPFGIYKAAPKVPGVGDKVRRGVRGAKGRLKRNAQTTWGNATSKPGKRKEPEIENLGRGMLHARPGGTFGKPKSMSDSRVDSAVTGATIAGIAGVAAGALTPSGLEANRKINHTQRLDQQLKNQKRQIKRSSVSKSRAHLITDVGTAAGRKYPHARKLSVIYGGTAAAGAGLQVGSNHLQSNLYGKQIKSQKAQVAANKKKLEELKKSIMAPKSVPTGVRIAPKAPKKKHKAKPKVGKGEYVKAPLIRDKVVQPRWTANALVNNPDNALALTGIGGGAFVMRDDKIKKSEDRKRRAAGGALVGGGLAQLGRVGADYGAKEIAERQFRPLTNKGNYGPYKDTPHKPVLNKYKRVANKEGGGDVRAKAKYFDENFPKGVPSYNARKVGVALNTKGAKAGAVAAGAGIGAGLAALKKDKVKKARSMSDAELRHRKKIQGRISQTTSTLGLTGVGIGGAAVLASKKPGALRAMQKLPKAKNLSADKLKDAGLYTSLASGGIGGVGGYNFAAYTNAESKRKQPVRKSEEGFLDTPVFGETND